MTERDEKDRAIEDLRREIRALKEELARIREERREGTVSIGEAVNAFVAKVREEKPAGVVVVPLHMNRWSQVARIARCGVPVVVFAPLGTAFTGHVQLVKKLPGVYLASSGDFATFHRAGALPRFCSTNSTSPLPARSEFQP